MAEKDGSENTSQIPEKVNESIENELKQEKPDVLKDMNINFNNIADQLEARIAKTVGSWGSQDTGKSEISRITARFPEQLNKQQFEILRDLTVIAAKATGGRTKKEG